MDWQISENNEVVDKIKETDAELKKELEKDNFDKDKIFKLRYRQMIQGLYLQDINNINKF
jgi:hypothetical protein